MPTAWANGSLAEAPHKCSCIWKSKKGPSYWVEGIILVSLWAWLHTLTHSHKRSPAMFQQQAQRNRTETERFRAFWVGAWYCVWIGLAELCWASFHERYLTEETTTQTYSVCVCTMWFTQFNEYIGLYYVSFLFSTNLMKWLKPTMIWLHLQVLFVYPQPDLLLLCTKEQLQDSFIIIHRL